MNPLPPSTWGGRIKSIYLDQCVYSESAKAALRGETPDSMSSISSHVSAGTVYYPLSLAHACELASWHNIEARDAAIALMLKFSQGLVMAHIVDVCTGHRPVTWAPFIVPVVSAAQSNVEALDGPSPLKKVTIVFENLAKDVERPADKYVENMLAAMNALSDQQSSPSEASTTEGAWILDVCLRRTSDPKRDPGAGDAFDIMHTCYVGLADYGVLDRSHAAMLRDSKHLRGRIFSRVEDALDVLEADLGTELGALTVKRRPPEWWDELFSLQHRPRSDHAPCLSIQGGPPTWSDAIQLLRANAAIGRFASPWRTT